jgi:hypothetical protein
MEPGAALAAARAAAAALDPVGGDGGLGRSLVRCGSGLRNTALLLSREGSDWEVVAPARTSARG